MKKPLIIVALGLAALVAVFFLGRYFAPSNGHRDGPGGAVEAESAEETVWTCSMHPQVRQPGPGSCPICGMDLIPVAGDDDDGDEGELPRLRLTERSIALMRIQTAPATRRESFATVRLPGRVEADETRESVVSAWFSGRADALTANFTGMLIEAGDPVLELYSPELFSAQEEFLQVFRAYRSQPGERISARLEDARERLALLGMSDAQIAELESTNAPATHLDFASPVSGFVTERMVTTGQYVRTGAPLYAVADLSVVWIQLEAYESELALLRTGQPVEIRLPGYPDAAFEGEVAYIDPELDTRKRTTRVRVELPNEDFRLKPGMLAAGVVRASPQAPTCMASPPYPRFSV